MGDGGIGDTAGRQPLDDGVLHLLHQAALFETGEIVHDDLVVEARKGGMGALQGLVQDRRRKADPVVIGPELQGTAEVAVEPGGAVGFPVPEGDRGQRQLLAVVDPAQVDDQGQDGIHPDRNLFLRLQMEGHHQGNLSRLFVDGTGDAFADHPLVTDQPLERGTQRGAGQPGIPERPGGGGMPVFDHAEPDAPVVTVLIDPLPHLLDPGEADAGTFVPERLRVDVHLPEQGIGVVPALPEQLPHRGE